MNKKIEDFVGFLNDEAFDTLLKSNKKIVHKGFLRLSRFVYHSFIPSARFNHRARLLHHGSIIGAIWIVILLTVSFRLIHIIDPAVLGISYSITTSELLSITNESRSKQGLSPLKINDQLSEAAVQKANDMLLKNYWAHYAPDGTTPWSFIKSTGYNYIYAGENLAKGFTSSSDVVKAWFDSPSHRENMMSPKYSDIGFAVVEGTLGGEETVLVVEMFGTTSTTFVASGQNSGTVAVPTITSFVTPTLSPVVPTVATPAIEKVEPPAEVRDFVAEARNVKSQQNTYIDTSIVRKPLINLGAVPKSITLTILGLFLLALFLDLMIIERRKIPRIVGHNLDHIMLISFLILYIVIVRSGSIF